MPAEFDKVASNGHGVDPRYVPQTSLETQRELVVPAGRVRLTFNVIIEGLLPEGANREQSAQPVEPPTPQGDHRLAGENGREGATPLVITEIQSPNGRVPETPVVRKEILPIEVQLKALYGPTGWSHPAIEKSRTDTLGLALDTVNNAKRRHDGSSDWKRIGRKRIGKRVIVGFRHSNDERIAHRWDIGPQTAFSPWLDGTVRPSSPFGGVSAGCDYPIELGFMFLRRSKRNTIWRALRMTFWELDHKKPIDYLRATAADRATSLLGPTVDRNNVFLYPGEDNRNKKGVLKVLYPIGSLDECLSVLRGMNPATRPVRVDNLVSVWSMIREALPPFWPPPLRDFWESIEEE